MKHRIKRCVVLLLIYMLVVAETMHISPGVYNPHWNHDHMQQAQQQQQRQQPTNQRVYPQNILQVARSQGRNVIQPQQRSVYAGAEPPRQRSLLDLGAILDPLLGTPITLQTVAIEVIKFPIKQTLVSVYWTNEHIFRRIVQALNRHLSNFYNTYLSGTDLPLFVAIGAFFVGIWTQSLQKTDEVMGSLDTFFNDILNILVS